MVLSKPAVERPGEDAAVNSTTFSSAGVRIAILLGAAALFSPLMSGCSSYQLRGKVIRGDISHIAIVSADDARFEGPGVSGVEVRLQTDPTRLNRKTVGTDVSGPDGSFSISVDEVGAGVLIYDVGLTARGRGYIGAEQFFRLPPSDKRILIMLERGADNRDFREEEDLFEEYRRLNR